MNKIIVARYNEDTAWTEQLAWEVMLVQKDKDLPNQGREASSYFWAITQLYDQLKNDDQLVFLQGNPEPHTTVYDINAKLANGFYGVEPFGSVFVTLGNGLPHHLGLPVAKCYEKWLGRPFPGEIEYVIGAQFGVRGKRIKRYSKKFYQQMQAEMCLAEHPWVMERLWLELFKK